MPGSPHRDLIAPRWGSRTETAPGTREPGAVMVGAGSVSAASLDASPPRTGMLHAGVPAEDAADDLMAPLAPCR